MQKNESQKKKEQKKCRSSGFGRHLTSKSKCFICKQYFHISFAVGRLLLSNYTISSIFIQIVLAVSNKKKQNSNNNNSIWIHYLSSNSMKCSIILFMIGRKAEISTRLQNSTNSANTYISQWNYNFLFGSVSKQSILKWKCKFQISNYLLLNLSICCERHHGLYCIHEEGKKSVSDGKNRKY